MSPVAASGKPFILASVYSWPCGYYGDLKRECRCGPVVIQKYRQRISGPLRDRIDLHVEVPAVEYKTLTSTEQTEESEMTLNHSNIIGRPLLLHRR